MSLWEAVGRGGTCAIAVLGTLTILTTWGVEGDLAFAAGLIVGLGASWAYSRYVWRGVGSGTWTW